MFFLFVAYVDVSFTYMLILVSVIIKSLNLKYKISCCRRREVSMSNGAGGNGSGEPGGGFYTAHSYMSPQYVRTPYPGAYPGASGFVRAYPPFQQHNGEIVYTYQPPPGASFIPAAGFTLPPSGPPPTQQNVPPPPQAVPPPQAPPPQQSKPLQPPPLSCYNCGSQSHSANECPEPSIEEVTKQGLYKVFSTSSGSLYLKRNIEQVLLNNLA